MDITDPCTEVWICPCGAPLREPGLCAECERNQEEPFDISFFKVIICIVFLMIIMGLFGAVGLVIHAAWLMDRTFEF